jgi:MFS family permease
VRFAALHARDYRRYFVLALLSMTADNIEHVISYWVMFQTFHSPTLAGFAVISHWVPFLLFSFHAGALADRHDCRKLIQISQALFMLASILWGVLFLTDTLRVWHAVVLLLIHGAAGVIISPAVQLIIHDMVNPAQLPSAIRLNASSRYLAILLGPAVGGGLMLLLGPAWGLLANVLIYLPFTIFLTRVPYTGHTARPEGRRPPPRLRDAWPLLAEVRADRRLVTMMVLGGATSFFVGSAFQAQMPEYAHDLGSDEAGVWYSVLLAANAAGAILGAVLLESVNAVQPSARAAVLSAAAWGVTIGLFAVAPSYPVAVTLLVLAGGVQHRLHVDRPDARATAGAAARAGQRGRALQHGQPRPAGGQRRHRRRAGSRHQRPLVAGPERGGGGGDLARPARARDAGSVIGAVLRHHRLVEHQAEPGAGRHRDRAVLRHRPVRPHRLPDGITLGVGEALDVRPVGHARQQVL